MPNASELRALELAAKLIPGERQTVRLTIRIGPQLRKRLEEMREITGVHSLQDVVSNALFLYDALVYEKTECNDVYVISSDGTKTKYPIFK